MKYEDLTTEQKRWLNEEEKEIQEMILYALRRKPFYKITKTGLIIGIKYIYIDRALAFDCTLSDRDGQKIWQKDITFCTETPLEGEEKQSYAIAAMMDHIADMERDELSLLVKKLIGIN